MPPKARGGANTGGKAEKPKKVTITSRESAVQIEGMRDFMKALKMLDAEYPKAVKQANVDLAKKLIDLAKQRAGREGGVARRAARSLRPTHLANASAILGGSARHPYFFGAEFGAKQYRQFRAWRGNQWGGWRGGPGYFLHPTIRDHASELIDEYMRRLDELTDEAFPD